MGSSRNFLCKTCQKDYYLGYGSSISWMTEGWIPGGIQTPAQYDSCEAPERDKSLAKNQRFKECLTEHADHDWFVRDDENDEIRQREDGGTDLWACYATGVQDFCEKLFERYDLCEKIDLEKRDEEVRKAEEARILARSRELYKEAPDILPTRLAELINTEFGADSMDEGWAERVLRSVRPKPELPKELRRKLKAWEARRR